jgi:cytochrome P450
MTTPKAEEYDPFAAIQRGSPRPTPPAAEAYDPFAAFSDVIAGTSRNPWPALAAKRRDDPVSKGTTMPRDALPEGFNEEPGWIAYRYEDCSRILRDAKTFTSTGYDSTIGMVMGHMILGMDDPEHRDHRNLVAHAFREKSLARWEPEFIGPIVDELIDRFAADGEADLVRQLTFEFPVRVISRLLGLPEEDFPQFQRWSVELIGLVADIERGLAASESLREYFAEVVAERRAKPAEDVISDLVTAEVDGEKLTDEAIYSFLRLLLPAGAETTYRSSGNLLFLLLAHPDQMEAVRTDRSLLPQAIEEGLRAEPPLLTINRTTTCEVEIAGVTIGPGESITPHIGSANHDETRWEDAESFDIFRRPLPHIAFAHGPHMCLGMHLARLETRVVVNRVLDRLPSLTFDPGDTDPYIRGDVFRSPTALPVTFTAAP